MLKVLLTMLVVVGAGCTSVSRFEGNPIESANAEVAAQEVLGHTGSSHDDRAKLRHVYADRPDVLELIDRSEAGRLLPRFRTSTPPSYPISPLLRQISTTVRVAFIVDESGKVEDPRVVEAPDSRFIEPALSAVSDWTFFPGSSSGQPDRFLFLLDIKFAPERK